LAWALPGSSADRQNVPASLLRRIARPNDTRIIAGSPGAVVIAHGRSAVGMPVAVQLCPASRLISRALPAAANIRFTQCATLLCGY
jgi:hypothetical protein